MTWNQTIILRQRTHGLQPTIIEGGPYGLGPHSSARRRYLLMGPYHNPMVNMFKAVVWK